RLRQLGRMVRLEVDRVQQTESGQLAPKDGKVERGDTQFIISIYNLANIAPRETVTLRLAVTDVAATYEALRETAGGVQAKVITAMVSKQGAAGVTGQLDFATRRADEAAVQKALAQAGTVISRQLTRAAASDNVTDAKVQYRIELVPEASLTPRDTI